MKTGNLRSRKKDSKGIGIECRLRGEGVLLNSNKRQAPIYVVLEIDSNHHLMLEADIFEFGPVEWRGNTLLVLRQNQKIILDLARPTDLK